MEAYVLETIGAAFAQSCERFETMVSWLDDQHTDQLTHAELETRLQTEGRELLRQLLQDHLDLRAQREPRLVEVIGADGAPRRSAETGRTRGLATVFGPVTVRRLAYRDPGHASLHPADGVLNLPEEKYSHGLRLLAARLAAQSSFAHAAEAIARATGQRLGNRQVEELTQHAAVDFDRFYAQRPRHLSLAGDALVLSYDAKGVVMHPEALRPATAAAVTTTVAAGLSRTPRQHRKRMAEIGSVYDCTPVPRTSRDILVENDQPLPGGPKARNKWLTASIATDAAEVIIGVFDEASRRDPGHQRPWVVLVDGNTHQIDCTHTQARARHVPVTIVIDFVHVLEYLYKAARCLFPDDDPTAHRWVRTWGLRVLDGHSSQVAGAIHRQATHARLAPAQRADVDTCATYLTNKRPYLNYPAALERGWPIATGVIEGACRHLVQDRMGVTGARWGLDSAEAVLKLRALISNNDFDDYWAYHLTQEKHRVHDIYYANKMIPAA